MENAWNVLWIEGESRKIKVFEGDSPKASGAVDFAKSKGHGLDNVHIISRRKAFPPPLKHRNPPGIGLIWCPYCIKWRAFEEYSIKREDYTTPDLLRCTVCTISIMDYYVRKYNPVFVERYLTSLETKKKINPKKAPVRRGLRR